MTTQENLSNLPVTGLNALYEVIHPSGATPEEQMQHWLELQTFFRKKRNRNACNEHKRKHQRCPLDCPGRKNKKKSKSAGNNKSTSTSTASIPKAIGKDPLKTRKKIEKKSKKSLKKELVEKSQCPSTPIEIPPLGICSSSCSSSETPSSPVSELMPSSPTQVLFSVLPFAPPIVQPLSSTQEPSSPNKLKLQTRPQEISSSSSSSISISPPVSSSIQSPSAASSSSSPPPLSSPSPFDPNFRVLISKFFAYQDKVSPSVRQVMIA